MVVSQIEHGRILPADGIPFSGIDGIGRNARGASLGAVHTRRHYVARMTGAKRQWSDYAGGSDVGWGKRVRLVRLSGPRRSDAICIMRTFRSPGVSNA